MDDPTMRYAQAHDMDSWQRDERIARRGFTHPWQSKVAAGNGEDAFIALVEQHLHPDSDVLDLGCGHGELTLNLAARCRTIVGIERIPEYLQLAQELTVERGTTNVRFFQVNLAGPDEEDRDFRGIPLPDDSIDLFVNRRGPLLHRYLAEAIRVARRGAVIVGLHPGNRNASAPPWRDDLPQIYQGIFSPHIFDEVMGWVADPLEQAGLVDYSLWWIDVPEFFRSPHELYVRLSAHGIPEVPAYEDVEPQFAMIFQQHATSHGVVLRHQRLLWQVHL